MRKKGIDRVRDGWEKITEPFFKYSLRINHYFVLSYIGFERNDKYTNNEEGD